MGLVASAMQVFMHTNKFKPDEPFYANHATVQLEATADTFQLVACAIRTAQRLWRDGYRYAKAGVILLDLGSVRLARQHNLLPSDDNEQIRGPDEGARQGQPAPWSRRAATRQTCLAQPAGGCGGKSSQPEFTTSFEEMMRVSA